MLTPSLLVLLLANALPIAGVLLLGWTVFPLVLLYWLENVVVGGFNVARLLLAQPREPAYWGGQAVPHPVLRGALRHVHVHPRRAGGGAVRSQGNCAVRPARDGPTGDTRQSPGLGRGQPGGEPRTLVVLELPRERRIPARLPQRPDDAALQPSSGAAPHGAVRRLDRHGRRVAAARPRASGRREDGGRPARTHGRTAQVRGLTPR